MISEGQIPLLVPGAVVLCFDRDVVVREVGGCLTHATGSFRGENGRVYCIYCFGGKSLDLVSSPPAQSTVVTDPAILRSLGPEVAAAIPDPVPMGSRWRDRRLPKDRWWVVTGPRDARNEMWPCDLHGPNGLILTKVPVISLSEENVLTYERLPDEVPVHNPEVIAKPRAGVKALARVPAPDAWEEHVKKDREIGARTGDWRARTWARFDVGGRPGRRKIDRAPGVPTSWTTTALVGGLMGDTRSEAFRAQQRREAQALKRWPVGNFDE